MFKENLKTSWIISIGCSIEQNLDYDYFFFKWFGTKQNSMWCQINCKSRITIDIWFSLTIFENWFTCEYTYIVTRDSLYWYIKGTHNHVGTFIGTQSYPQLCKNVYWFSMIPTTTWVRLLVLKGNHNNVGRFIGSQWYPQQCGYVYWYSMVPTTMWVRLVVLKGIHNHVGTFIVTQWYPQPCGYVYWYWMVPTTMWARISVLKSTQNNLGVYTGTV